MQGEESSNSENAQPDDPGVPDVGVTPQLLEDGYLEDDDGVFRLTEKGAALVAFVFDTLTVADVAMLVATAGRDAVPDPPWRTPIMCPDPGSRPRGAG